MTIAPSKTDERVPSQQGARKELRKEFWVWPKGGKFASSAGGGRGEGEGRRKRYLTNSTYQLFKTSVPLRHPELTHSFQEQIIFSQIS